MALDLDNLEEVKDPKTKIPTGVKRGKPISVELPMEQSQEEIPFYFSFFAEFDTLCMENSHDIYSGLFRKAQPDHGIDDQLVLVYRYYSPNKQFSF